uniref:Kinesin-like protein n=1 Tax=Fagus sylvatica TaxID=28930 RepID=A0A2N9FRJ6_FAGSY
MLILEILVGNEYELVKKYLKESSERKRLDNEVICSDSSKKQFKFDHVFRPEDNQEAVFAQTKPIVTSVLDGYNVCIFGYGQTGTGKRFTMEGTPENRGVNYRTLEELLNLEEAKPCSSVALLALFYEENQDKTRSRGNKKSRDLLRLVFMVLRMFEELLKSGSRVRSVGSTNANELSSRSHCLLRVSVKGENLINGQKTRSHLWLVDLAGSERVGRIEVEGERLKESQFINKSLSALGDELQAHTYAAELSRIAGGDCKTLMFVQISPNAADQGETLCSLNFASRVHGIESGPARKQADISELFKYKQMAEKLKHDEKETKKLQDNLQSMQLKLSAREHICRNLQEKVRDLESQLAEERKTILKQETRAFSAASAQASGLSSLKQAAHKSRTEKRPPLAQYSRLFSPLPELRTAVETTPTAMRSSSKFMGSPPTQAGSWKPKHPTVVARQWKPLVWSPLKLRGLKNYRRPSLLPSQPLTEMQ